MNEGVFDLLPDDARHLVAIELDNRAFYLDLGQAFLLICRAFFATAKQLTRLEKYLDVEILMGFFYPSQPVRVSLSPWAI
jgi:hypothetical protein